MLKDKIIFIGTPNFSAIILEKLIKNGYLPILVITSPDKKVGRKQILTPSPVKIIAQKYDIPIQQPEQIQSLKLKIENLQPDLAIVASYGKILPKEILNIPKYGCLNVHPSLLPKYRGATPIQSAILNKDKETGVTIMLMDEKMDHGPIILNIKYEIVDIKINYEKLHNKLAEIGAELLIKAIPKWLNKEINSMPQDESKATYTKILKKEDGKIDWNKSAEVLEREIRAFYPWPSSQTNWLNKGRLIKIKILESEVYFPQEKIIEPIGKTTINPLNQLIVQCGENFLKIKKLQPEGKKEMSADSFLRGYPNFIGSILK